MKELFVIAVIILVVSTVHAQDVTGVQELSPDPSDPTRIDTRAGAGYKYTDFTGGASLNEL